MSIESADDWKGLRRAGRIAHLTLEALEAQRAARVSPPRSSMQWRRAIFAAHGARSAPAMVYGFPGDGPDQRQRRSRARHPRPSTTRGRRSGQARCDGGEGRLHRRRRPLGDRRIGLRRRDGVWRRARARHLPRRWRSRRRAPRSTRSAARSSPRCGGAGSPSCAASPATASAARFTSRRRCRISTTPGSVTC